MLIIFNARAVEFNNTHIFSLMIILVSILIILYNRLSVLEKEDNFKFRYLILGAVCAYAVYNLEKIILS